MLSNNILNVVIINLNWENCFCVICCNSKKLYNSRWEIVRYQLNENIYKKAQVKGLSFSGAAEIIAIFYNDESKLTLYT